MKKLIENDPSLGKIDDFQGPLNPEPLDAVAMFFWLFVAIGIVTSVFYIVSVLSDNFPHTI